MRNGPTLQVELSKVDARRHLYSDRHERPWLLLADDGELAATQAASKPRRFLLIYLERIFLERALGRLISTRPNCRGARKAAVVNYVDL